MIDLLKLVQDARSLRDRTKRAYATGVRQWLEFAGHDPAGWTPVQAQAFYDHMLKRLSPATLNNVTVVGLQFAFDRANTLYGIPNPIGAIDPAKPPVDRDDVRRALTAPQVKALLAACAGTRLIDHRDHALVTLGLYTGMRAMSLAAVETWEPGDDDTYWLCRVPLKGGALYSVPVDARVRQALAPYADAVSPGRLFQQIRPRVTPDGDTTVPVGGLSEDGVYRALRTRGTAAGLTFHPHLLRHTFVTWCRSGGVDELLIAAVTGHKPQAAVRMLDTYTDKRQLARDAARLCYAAVAARLAEPPDRKD
ncbi:MAG: site-specific integrase [Tessaracoccus sp.]|uniref:tyrosine-type recombinase/integrase n=1 Tax=Tessaracoccus sp. TaxID=1971211 RepID=UPI001EB54D0B|nr:site-specific integrase [Tessaracoccus sp.]MBK7823117.1 site-specific integrase [Tessaracoccus sp.]